MAIGFLKDANGDFSSSRLFEAFIVATIIIISFISVFTGNDLGSNTAQLLQFIGSFSVASVEGKKAMEFYTNKKLEK